MSSTAPVVTESVQATARRAACERSGPVSGRYEGESTSVPVAGQERALDLRIDVDARYQNSSVMNRVSGDLFQVQRIQIPGQPAQSWRVYQESWIVDNPQLAWADCHVLITGQVRYWRGIHPETTLQIKIPWRTADLVGPAAVSLNANGGDAWGFVCRRTGDWFREMNLEAAVCESVNQPPLLPTYDTHAHDDRPADLPRRTLTVPECYREAGMRVTVRPNQAVIDDSVETFSTWSSVELHDAMETHFSQFPGTWPKWEMWGLIAGTYDNPGVGGLMFDAAASNGGAGRAPDRQGFAVFRKHMWFDSLPVGAPSNQAEAEALRKYLYTWVHEAGHAFNFLHSWDKNRPNALSWMNYDWRYDGRNGSGTFWQNFRMRFDDEELLHLRHGSRPAVIGGGDPWASGGHAEAPAAAEYLRSPPGAMAELEGNPPLELLLRSKGYFEFMEPVHVEFRLRNLLPSIALTLDTRMGPEYGGVTVFIRRPDGRVVEYDPILCLIATTETNTLASAPASGEQDGRDRFSQSVFLSYGKHGFYFDAPGEYLVRAVYRGAGDVLIPSNTLNVRIGAPFSKAEDKMAQDYYSYGVGMSLYLGGSPSPHLQKGMDVIREIVDTVKEKDSMLKARLSTILATAISMPFHRMLDNKVVKVSDGDSGEALALTESAVSAIRDAKSKSLNLAYRTLIQQRALNFVDMDKPDKARKELATLQKDLKVQGANANVLEDIKSYYDKIRMT